MDVKQVEKTKPKEKSIKCELVYENNELEYINSCSILKTTDGNLVFLHEKMYFSICNGSNLTPDLVNKNCSLFNGSSNNNDLL